MRSQVCLLLLSFAILIISFLNCDDSHMLEVVKYLNSPKQAITNVQVVSINKLEVSLSFDVATDSFIAEDIHIVDTQGNAINTLAIAFDENRPNVVILETDFLSSNERYSLTIMNIHSTSTQNTPKGGLKFNFVTTSFQDFVPPTLLSICIHSQEDYCVDYEESWILPAIDPLYPLSSIEMVFDEAMESSTVQLSSFLQINEEAITLSTGGWSDFKQRVIFSIEEDYIRKIACFGITNDAKDARGNSLSNPLNPLEFVIGAPEGADDFEPDNSFDEASFIETSSVYAATLHSESDEDYYSISLNSDKQYYISLYSVPDDLVYDMQVYAGKDVGTLLDSPDIQPMDSTPLKYLVNPPIAGDNTYYVKVYSIEGYSITQKYAILVKELSEGDLQSIYTVSYINDGNGSSPSGPIQVLDGEENPISLSAGSPDPGYAFYNYTYAGEGEVEFNPNAYAENAKITVSGGDVQIIANYDFTTNMNAITYASAGNGDPPTGPDYVVDGVEHATPLAEGTPDSWYEFDYYSSSGDGSVVFNPGPDTPGPRITVSGGDATITIHYKLVQHQFTMHSNQGTGTVTTLSPLTGSYDHGELTLEATGIDASSEFIGWYSDASCTVLISSSNPSTLSFTGDAEVYPVVDIKEFSVTMGSNLGDGSYTTIVPSTGIYEYGSLLFQVTLDTGSNDFIGWYKDPGPTLVSISSSYNHSLTADITMYPYVDTIDYDWTTTSPSTGPGSSSSADIAFLTDDKILLFGDSLGTWVYDISSDSWSNQNPGGFTPPADLKVHRMANIGDRFVVLFGGYTPPANKQDQTWVYDYSGNSWTRKYPTSKPSARYNHAMAYIGGDRIILHGGYTTTWDNETWQYDLSDNNWTNLNPSSPRPDGRMNHELAYIGNNRVLTFGGYRGSPGILEETWVYNISSNTWTNRNPSSYPTKRQSFGLASHTTDKAICSFGITDSFIYLNDVWEYNYNENVWREKNPPSAPEERRIASMVYLPTPDQMLIYGGYDGSTTYGDVRLFYPPD